MIRLPNSTERRATTAPCARVVARRAAGSFAGTAALRCVQEMSRALFVFAKLNPGLRYVQGMNELLAPLYYQFRNDTDGHARQHAEADAFYCFMDIIAEFRDHFCQQLVSR